MALELEPHPEDGFAESDGAPPLSAGMYSAEASVAEASPGEPAGPRRRLTSKGSFRTPAVSVLRQTAPADVGQPPPRLQDGRQGSSRRGLTKLAADWSSARHGLGEAEGERPTTTPGGVVIHRDVTPQPPLERPSLRAPRPKDMTRRRTVRPRPRPRPQTTGGSLQAPSLPEPLHEYHTEPFFPESTEGVADADDAMRLQDGVFREGRFVRRSFPSASAVDSRSQVRRLLDVLAEGGRELQGLRDELPRLKAEGALFGQVLGEFGRILDAQSVQHGELASALLGFHTDLCRRFTVPAEESARRLQAVRAEAKERDAQYREALDAVAVQFAKKRQAFDSHLHHLEDHLDSQEAEFEELEREADEREVEMLRVIGVLQAQLQALDKNHRIEDDVVAPKLRNAGVSLLALALRRADVVQLEQMAHARLQLLQRHNAQLEERVAAQETDVRKAKAEALGLRSRAAELTLRAEEEAEVPGAAQSRASALDALLDVGDRGRPAARFELEQQLWRAETQRRARHALVAEQEQREQKLAGRLPRAAWAESALGSAFDEAAFSRCCRRPTKNRTWFAGRVTALCRARLEAARHAPPLPPLHEFVQQTMLTQHPDWRIMETVACDLLRCSYDHLEGRGSAAGSDLDAQHAVLTVFARVAMGELPTAAFDMLAALADSLPGFGEDGVAGVELLMPREGVEQAAATLFARPESALNKLREGGWDLDGEPAVPVATVLDAFMRYFLELHEQRRVAVLQELRSEDSNDDGLLVWQQFRDAMTRVVKVSEGALHRLFRDAFLLAAATSQGSVVASAVDTVGAPIEGAMRSLETLGYFSKPLFSALHPQIPEATEEGPGPGVGVGAGLWARPEVM